MTSNFHTDYAIRWRQYRGFEDTGWVTLRPITILIGPNNSGKTSILSPLLLLNQTLLSSDTETPLVTRGPLIDAGNYKDFVHLHDDRREILFGLKFHSHAPPKKLREVGRYPPGAVELSFRRGDEPQQVKLSKYALYDIYHRAYLSRILGPGGEFSLEDGPLPLSKMFDRERKAVLASRTVHFHFSPNSALYALEADEETDTQSKQTRFSETFSLYLRTIGFAYSNVRTLFRNLSYVGPLRQKLRRFYRISAATPDTVGAQGENAPNLYRRKRRELQAEVSKWIKQFEFGDTLLYRPLTDDLFQLVFKSGTEETNVTDAGFGASQVLPLIIQALAAPEDSLTIAEQPEIHLNPRLQCVLGNLFVHMANSGHRVLLETHSEHLLIRLRRLVAAGAISAENVALYFVERKDGCCTIREVPIEANGHISRDSWPSGFFEDALRESLALANEQSKRGPRKKGRG